MVKEYSSSKITTRGSPTEDIMQDTTIPIKGSWEFPQFCPSVQKSKKNFGHSFAFDAPPVWNDLPIGSVLPQLLFVSEKG